MGTSKPRILVPLFHLKFLVGIRCVWCRNFKWAALVSICVAAFWLAGATPVPAQPAQVDRIADVLARLRTCWKPPDPWRVHPGIDITVIVSF